MIFPVPIPVPQQMQVDGNKLLVIWTSAEREVALNMVLMYVYNAKYNDWWQHITLLIWGPAQQLLLTATEVREKIVQISNTNVRLIACRACAENYEIVQELSALGIEVFGTGE